jgi:hypothetical protein
MDFSESANVICVLRFRFGLIGTVNAGSDTAPSGPCSSSIGAALEKEEEDEDEEDDEDIDRLSITSGHPATEGGESLW